MCVPNFPYNLILPETLSILEIKIQEDLHIEKIIVSLRIKCVAEKI